MTEHLKYSMGTQHTQWTLRLTINQRGMDYKFVMSDTDDDWYIGTNYVSAATANDLQEAIEKSIDKAKYSENIDDVFAETIGAEPVSNLPETVYFKLCHLHLNGKVKGDKRKQKIAIFLPHLVDVRIKAIEIEDGSVVEEYYSETEQKRTLLCLGDSITQGMTAKNPSSAYPVQLSKMLGMKMINHGVGGYVFNEKSLDEKMDIKPDIITVAYGINDWYKYNCIDYFREMCNNFFNKLTTIYPEAKIFTITPIWCSSEGEVKTMGYLFEIRKVIEQIACSFKAVHVVDGLKMVPNMPDYFVDGVHPNDLGFMHYSMNLGTHLSKT